MTLQPYSPDQLDRLALHLLDLAAIVREMANRSREHQLTDLALHDKKALEWCGNLEKWAHKSQADVELRIRQVKAERRAAAAGH